MTRLVEIRFKDKIQYVSVNTTLSDDKVVSEAYSMLRQDKLILKLLHTPKRRKVNQSWIQPYSFFGHQSAVEFTSRIYQSLEEAKDELFYTLVKVTIVPAHNCVTREYGPFDSDF